MTKKQLQFDSGEAGALQGKKVEMPTFDASQIKTWGNMKLASVRMQRLCLLLAKLGVQSARWHLPVGVYDLYGIGDC